MCCFNPCTDVWLPPPWSGGGGLILGMNPTKMTTTTPTDPRIPLEEPLGPTMTSSKKCHSRDLFASGGGGHLRGPYWQQYWLQRNGGLGGLELGGSRSCKLLASFHLLASPLPPTLIWWLDDFGGYARNWGPGICRTSPRFGRRFAGLRRCSPTLRPQVHAS